MIHLSVQERGVYLLVPYEERVDDGVYLFTALERACGAVYEFDFESEHVALACQQAHHQVELCGRIAVEGYDGAFRAHLVRDGGYKLLGHGLRAAGYD